MQRQSLDTGTDRLTALARLLLDIALLRRGPQDLPASSLLLAISLALAALTGLAVELQFKPLPRAALAVVLGIVVDLVWVGGVLVAARRGARVLQTLSAVEGTSAVLGMAFLPFAMLYSIDGEAYAGILSLAWLLVVGWSLAVMASILRHALDASWGQVLVLAAAYFFVSILATGTAVIDSILGVPVAATAGAG